MRLTEGILRHYQLEPRLVADEFVRAETDRVFFEPVVANLLHIVLGDDPAGGADQRAVVGHEIGPRLIQHKLHAVRIDNPYFLYLLVQLCPLRAAEAELDVFGGKGIAVVEFHPLAQIEFIDALILAHGPGFGEARRHALAGHRLHQRIVQRVQNPERGQRARRRLPRVHPGRRQGHVKRPSHLAFGLGLRGRRAGTSSGQGPCEESGQGNLMRLGQGSFPYYRYPERACSIPDGKHQAVTARSSCRRRR
jgi:hypothetical protein